MRIYNQKGEKANNWKGGKTKSRGYIMIYSPEHPLKKGSYVARHRLTMEEYLRKNEPDHPALIEIDGELYLSPEWIPHHKNGKRDDNRIENLELMTDSEHKRYHASGKHHSKESREKMSLDRMGAKNPNFGKHFSKEHKEKLALSKQGRKNPNFGKHRSAEVIKKISKTLTGRHTHLSEKAEKKMILIHRITARRQKRDEKGRFLGL